MRKTKKRFLSALLTCAMIVSLFPFAAFADGEEQTDIVTSDGTITINATSNAANNGQQLQNAVNNTEINTIYITAGEYQVDFESESPKHHLWINRDNLTIIGEDGATITANYMGTQNGTEQQTVLINGDNVTLDNLTIEEVNGYANKTVEVQAAANATIKNCTIYSTSSAVYVGEPTSTGYTISNNEIKGGCICIANGAGGQDETNGAGSITGNTIDGSIYLNGLGSKDGSYAWMLYDLKYLPTISENTFVSPEKDSSMEYYLRSVSYEESGTTDQPKEGMGPMTMVSADYVNNFVENNTFTGNENYTYMLYPGNENFAYYGTTAVTSEEKLKSFVENATDGTVIKLANDITLTEKLTINKDVTIDGNGKTITGDANNTGVYIEVTGGTFNLSNATLKDFGGAVGTQSGNGVIKVPATAAEGTTVNTTDVNVSDFNRSAYDISAGTFSINGGTIDCENSNDADTVLTKGIKVGGTNSKVNGTISGVTINNSASTYADWNTAAIEIYSNADVDVTNCTISNVSKGIHVDNYWYDTGDITVNISGGNITADSDAVMIYSKADAVNNAAVNISGGNFSGNVRILDKTDKDIISITGGDYSVDPTEFVADGYRAQKLNDGTFKVVKKSEAGSVVPPTSDSEETVTNPDGSITTTITKEDGSSSTTTVGTDGKVESEVTISKDAVDNANGAAVTLSMPEVAVTSDKDIAATVTVNLPSKDATKVEVPVKDVTPGTVAVLVDADGNETVIKDTVQSENGITVEVTDGATIKVVDNSKTFDDVTDNYWGADAIDFATSRELFAGTAENTFSPEGDMTRAMIWSVLSRYEGADTSEAVGDEWYAGPQEWAIANGISDGTMPNDSMTREQFAAMLYRYVGSPDVSGTVGDYSDADSISSWASDAMVWAVQQGLIAGMDDGTLNPQGTATRTQVAAIFQRFIENKMA